MRAENKKILVITGASRGIGRNAAEIFRSNGFFVYDLSRSGISEEGIVHIDCDVTNYDDIDNAVNQVINEVGRIDVAISNAGFGISGSVEAHSYEDIEKQVRVNFMGSTFFTKAVLPYVRKSKGRILYLSSVAACVPIPFQAMYSATKAAILALALSVDTELDSSGARAIALLPGDIATDFTRGRIKNKYEPEFYAERVASSVGKMEHDEINGMKADVIGKELYRLATSTNPKPMSSVGILYRLSVVLSGILPVRLRQYIIRKMYG